jgi:hypothetical protein
LLDWCFRHHLHYEVKTTMHWAIQTYEIMIFVFVCCSSYFLFVLPIIGLDLKNLSFISRVWFLGGTTLSSINYFIYKLIFL